MEKEKRYTINQSELLVRFGNILNSKAEVVVSSDDNYLSMEGGVSKTILKAGGEEIKQDSRKFVPAQLGDVVVTTSGNLPQKYIFHCVTLKNDDGKRIRIQEDDAQRYIVRHSVEKSLHLMASLGIESIAFPSIGAGSARIPFEKVAMHMVEIITDFLQKTNKRYLVEIYLYDRYQKMEMFDYIVFFENLAKSIDRHQRKESPTQAIEKTRINTPTTWGKKAVTTPNENHMVFISYSSKDFDLAKEFCNALDELDISYWIYIHANYGGQNYKDVLDEAIVESKILVLLFSKNAKESDDVKKEVSIAVNQGIMVLPVKLDDSPFEGRYRYDFTDVDRIDYSENIEITLKKFKENISFYKENKWEG